MKIVVWNIGFEIQESNYAKKMKIKVTSLYFP
jgi:hypothetical protein